MVADPPLANQPDTSPINWTVPDEPLLRSTLPSAPTDATTRLDTVWPATKLRLAVFGNETPSG